VRLVYLIDARLPTERAHGYQICKMCEAFALNGVKVTLMHPFRHQSDPNLKGKSVFEYYGIRENFEVRTLPNVDVVKLSLVLRGRLFQPLFFCHCLLWSFYATQVARKEGADVYYTRETTIAFWLTKAGLPTIYEAHFVHKMGRRWLLRLMAGSPSLKLVIALTSFIKERLVRMGFDPKKIMVLPDAVDLSLFENLPSKEECRRLLGLPLERPIVGYVGRFVTMGMEKGVRKLIEAIGLMPTIEGKEPLLLCVGGPIEVVPHYIEHARRRGVPEERLRFVDRVPNTEVPIWIRACDVVTIPWQWTEFSAYFTSPLKLFEYMAAGVPIVASNLPSIREILCHGRDALLVEPGNPRALAEGIQRLLQDRRLAERLVRNARRSVRKYTWTERAKRILEAISGRGF